jgi:hypothetical protein
MGEPSRLQGTRPCNRRVQSSPFAHVKTKRINSSDLVCIENRLSVGNSAVIYRNGIIRLRMQREGTAPNIPRRPRRAFMSLLDDLLESAPRKRACPPNLLLSWSLCFAVGLALYWLCVRPGASHSSDIGWFLAIMMSFVILANGENFLKRFLFAAVPFIVSVVLNQRAYSAAGYALYLQTAASLLKYAAAASAFLLFMFLWVALLPGGGRPEYIPGKLWRTCQVILFVIGCVIVSFEAREMLGVLHSSTLSVVDQLHWLDRWVSRSTLVLYGLFAARFLLPLSIYRLTAHKAERPEMSSPAGPS